jgi:phenylacetate-CoA ligase
MLRNLFWNHMLPISGRFGYRIGKALKVMIEAEQWTRDEIETYQGEALHRLITHCYENVPYYGEIMKQRKLMPSDFKMVADISKMPLLTREDLRGKWNLLRSRIHPDSCCKFSRSGGTSGEPVTIALDSRARAFVMAAYIRGFTWMGHQWGNPIVQLFGGSLGVAKSSFRSWIVNKTFNSILLPAFELRPQTMKRYIEAVENSPNGSLVAYPSAALNFAKYASDMDWRPKLSTIICTAEQMPELWRKKISDVFKTPVYSYYGCNEVGSLGYQHHSDVGYIIPQEHAIVEIRKENPSELITEGEGELVVTSLFNYAMPIIRYINGDCGRIGYAEDGTLRHQRILELQGRVMDQLLDSRGISIGSVLPTYIIQKTGVELLKYQVVQPMIGQIEFHYEMPGASDIASADRALITEVFLRHLGNDTIIEFVRGGFELTPAGKHRLVINKVLSE